MAIDRQTMLDQSDSSIQINKRWLLSEGPQEALDKRLNCSRGRSLKAAQVHHDVPVANDRFTSPP